MNYKKSEIFIIINKYKKFDSTPAGIRTRVRALATPGDNRYTTGVICIRCPDPDLNRGQLPLQGSALPTELPGLFDPKHLNAAFAFKLIESPKRGFVVGPRRVELRTSAMSRRRHNQLDHEPICIANTCKHRYCMFH